MFDHNLARTLTPNPLVPFSQGSTNNEREKRINRVTLRITRNGLFLWLGEGAPEVIHVLRSTRPHLHAENQRQASLLGLLAVSARTHGQDDKTTANPALSHETPPRPDARSPDVGP